MELESVTIHQHHVPVPPQYRVQFIRGSHCASVFSLRNEKIHLFFFSSKEKKGNSLYKSMCLMAWKWYPIRPCNESSNSPIICYTIYKCNQLFRVGCLKPSLGISQRLRSFGNWLQLIVTRAHWPSLALSQCQRNYLYLANLKTKGRKMA